MIYTVYDTELEQVIGYWHEGEPEKFLVEDTPTQIFKNITDVDNVELLDYPLHVYRFNGDILEAVQSRIDTLLDIVPVPGTSLLAVQDRAKNKIDQTAGNVRLGYITSVPGQSETYILKEQEARDYIVAGYPTGVTLDNYPFIKQEHAHRSIAYVTLTTTQVADNIIVQADNWKLIGSNIEGIRLKYKEMITLATTPDDVTAIKNQGIADLLGI